MSTWAARYSATDEPELTIWRDGVEAERLSIDEEEQTIQWLACFPDLRADIAARVPVRECERPACALHAIGQGLCVLHGGRDEL